MSRPIFSIGDDPALTPYTCGMPLTCNIDAKGKRARFIMGVILITAAVLVAALWAWESHDWRRWAVVFSLACAGAFTVFEARAGWCAVRAMGFKTKV